VFQNYKPESPHGNSNYIGQQFFPNEHGFGEEEDEVIKISGNKERISILK
jgi:hypothetical protein